MPALVERVLIVAASLAIAIGVIALLSGGLLAGRDPPGVSGTDAGPGIGVPRPGRCAAAPRRSREPAYDSNPPTSGPHVPAAVTRDGAQRCPTTSCCRRSRPGTWCSCTGRRTRRAA